MTPMLAVPELVLNAASHTAIAGADVAQPLRVVAPEPALFTAEIIDREQTA